MLSHQVNNIFLIHTFSHIVTVAEKKIGQKKRNSSMPRVITSVALRHYPILSSVWDPLLPLHLAYHYLRNTTQINIQIAV